MGNVTIVRKGQIDSISDGNQGILLWHSINVLCLDLRRPFTKNKSSNWVQRSGLSEKMWWTGRFTVRYHWAVRCLGKTGWKRVSKNWHGSLSSISYLPCNSSHASLTDCLPAIVHSSPLSWLLHLEAVTWWRSVLKWHLESITGPCWLETWYKKLALCFTLNLNCTSHHMIL